MTQRKAWNPQNDPEQKARLDAHIKKVVDSCPPLTAAQRDQLALLLRPKPEPAERIDPCGASAVERMMGGAR